MEKIILTYEEVLSKILKLGVRSLCNHLPTPFFRLSHTLQARRFGLSFLTIQTCIIIVYTTIPLIVLENKRNTSCGG